MSCFCNKSTYLTLVKVVKAFLSLRIIICKMKIILSFLRLHPNTAFQTLLLTIRATPFFSKGFLPAVVDTVIILNPPIPIHVQRWSHFITLLWGWKKSSLQYLKRVLHLVKYSMQVRCNYFLMDKLCSSTMNQFRDFCFRNILPSKLKATYQTFCFLI